MHVCNVTLAAEDAYSIKHMKSLLCERYGDNVCIAVVSGRRNVVCLRSVCHLIVSNKWHNDQKMDEAGLNERIIY